MVELDNTCDDRLAAAKKAENWAKFVTKFQREVYPHFGDTRISFQHSVK